jgi:2-hydroxychromene-2-carboxylate isomerase
MADVEFFFDPVCPWAWVTSRWAVEVAEQRNLTIDWRFICLRIVNEAKSYATDFPEAYTHVHGGGQKMLRVAAAAREIGGNDAVGRLYTELGTRLHNDGRSRSELREGNLAVLPEAIAAAGLDASLLAAADDDTHDKVLRTETELGLSRTGTDVGTPIITFSPDTEGEASFFGPVINRIPRGDDAVRLWEAVETLARTPGMYELKRTQRERPEFS